jgi:hypothetical protein
VNLMVGIFGGNDAYWVILWNIFGLRMMRRARLDGGDFGKQMKNYNTGRGIGMKLSLEKMTESNRLLLERFILIVTSLRCKIWGQGMVLKGFD